MVKVIEKVEAVQGILLCTFCEMPSEGFDVLSYLLAYAFGHKQLLPAGTGQFQTGTGIVTLSGDTSVVTGKSFTLDSFTNVPCSVLHGNAHSRRYSRKPVKLCTARSLSMA